MILKLDGNESMIVFNVAELNSVFNFNLKLFLFCRYCVERESCLEFEFSEESDNRIK